MIDHPNVQVIGFVENLSDIFSSLRLTIAPLRFGAGIKGKVLTSMSYGVPCIMSEIAAEGIPLYGELRNLVADDPAIFAKKIRNLYTDRNAWMRTSALGRDLIKRQFGKHIVDEKMKSIIY